MWSQNRFQVGAFQQCGVRGPLQERLHVARQELQVQGGQALPQQRPPVGRAAAPGFLGLVEGVLEQRQVRLGRRPSRTVPDQVVPVAPLGVATREQGVQLANSTPAPSCSALHASHIATARPMRGFPMRRA